MQRTRSEKRRGTRDGDEKEFNLYSNSHFPSCHPFKGLSKNASLWSRGTIRQNEQSSKSTSFQGESDRLKNKREYF